MRIEFVVSLIAISVGFSALSRSICAQTIPELIEEANRSLGRSVEIETGPPPSLESVLLESDIIVRGTIGAPTSYLSADQTEIYSDYPILNPEILWPPAPTATPLPGAPPPKPAITITHIGGRIVVNGHSFTMEHTQLPPLKTGTEGVFLLKQDGAKYRIAGTFYGAFKAVAGGLFPLARFPGYATELQGKTTDEAVQAFIARKQLGVR
jgi:hypothetical protein